MAVLVTFTLKTHTIDDDKDHDTGIFVEVHDKNRNTIGYIANAQRSDDDSMHYNDGDVRQFTFPPVGNAIPKEDCLPSAWRMGIQASGPGETTVEGVIFHGGNDRWTFDAWLYLSFSDNTSCFGDKKGQIIESDNHELVWDDFSNTISTAG